MELNGEPEQIFVEVDSRLMWVRLAKESVSPEFIFHLSSLFLRCCPSHLVLIPSFWLRIIPFPCT